MRDMYVFIRFFQNGNNQMLCSVSSLVFPLHRVQAIGLDVHLQSSNDTGKNIPAARAARNEKWVVST